MGRLGIDVVGSRNQANAVLSAAWVKGSIGNDRGNQYAEIAVALTLKTPKGEDIWENTILATSRHYTSIRGDVFSHAFTEALTAAMSQIGSLWESKQVFSNLSPGGAETVAVIAPLDIRSDVDELPAIKAKPNKNSYAIVIGIEQYRQKLPKADFATHDAKTMTEYLTKVMGYPEENVVTLINDRALKSDFEKYFEKWLPNNAEKDGTVFVYYSGHGAPNPKTGDAFLVPYDGDPSFIDETGYPLKRLYDSLGKLQAREIVVALDSCFSGAGGRSVLAKGARPLVMTMEKSVVPSNIAVLSAASGEQISSTYEEKGHGLFTYFMLKGIKGDGDANGDGKIEIGELFDYIKPQVERTARKTYNNEQSPQLIAPSEKQKVFLRE
ncbi:MAG: caspase family protein [Nitrospinae bacterium]|nr:caspase family protein [Nitrospinota bacterium]